VPIAIWVVVGGLALATAGLTGALVMRSAEPAPAGTAAAPAPGTPDKFTALEGSTTVAQQQAGTKVHAAQAEAQPAPQPQRAPKPAPSRPVQVAQAGATPAPVPVAPQRAPVCASCGTVESVHAIEEKGQGSGLGVVAGGVLGGIVGNQFGGGHGKTAMTVIGAGAGALAGNEVEKRARATTTYDVRVRMEDGSVRSFRQSQALAVGTRVTVDGNTLRAGA
jgi:outer membrane lipoprotein SlyB